MRVPEGWEVKALEALLLDDSPGFWGSPPSGNPIAVIRSTNLCSDGTLKLKNIAYRTFPDSKIRQKSLLPMDILLERSGGGPDTPVGRVAMFNAKGAYAFSNFMQRLRIDPRICDPKYILYLLWAFHASCKTTTFQQATTGIRNLNYKEYLRWPRLLPPLPEQQKIAAILSSVDETIQATRETIEQTKKVKQGLMQELLTRGIGHTRFKKTEIGEIPESWSVRRLLDVAHVVEGLVDPKQAEYRTLSLIAPNHIESGTGRILQSETAEEQRAISGKYEFMPRDVLYSKIRPYLRKVAYASFRGLCSADMYALRCYDELHPKYLAHLLLSEDFTKFANSVSMRTGIPKLNRSELGTYYSALPPITEQHRIVEILSSVDDLLQLEESDLHQFEQTKKGLMQDLLTGKVRVAV